MKPNTKNKCNRLLITWTFKENWRRFHWVTGSSSQRELKTRARDWGKNGVYCFSSYTVYILIQFNYREVEWKRNTKLLKITWVSGKLELSRVWVTVDKTARNVWWKSRGNRFLFKLTRRVQVSKGRFMSACVRLRQRGWEKRALIWPMFSIIPQNIFNKIGKKWLVFFFFFFFISFLSVNSLKQTAKRSIVTVSNLICRWRLA